MHDWSEADFDWKSLNDTCNFFRVNLHRYARFNFTGCKEKYGTLRFEYFGCCHPGIYGLFKPGRLYMNKTYHKYFYKIDKFITAIARKLGITRLFWEYQKFIFNIITVIAVTKWPHIKYEILDELEFRELLYNWVKRKINYVSRWTDVV